MPLVQIKGVENVLTLEQKQQMIRKVTDAIVSVEGENIRQLTWVIIEDISSGDWGIAGNSITTDDVKAIAQGG